MYTKSPDGVREFVPAAALKKILWDVAGRKGRAQSIQDLIIWATFRVPQSLP